MVIRKITVLPTSIILTPHAVTHSRKSRQEKSRPEVDARHVFTEAYASVFPLPYTGDETAAADHYVALMKKTWLVCAKDEEVCRALASLTIGRVTPYNPLS